MKKILVFALVAVMALSMVACNNDKDDKADETKEAVESEADEVKDEDESQTEEAAEEEPSK